MDIFRPALFNFVLSVFVYITSFAGIVKVAVISLKKTKPDNSTAIISLTGRGVLIQYLIFFLVMNVCMVNIVTLIIFCAEVLSY